MWSALTGAFTKYVAPALISQASDLLPKAISAGVNYLQDRFFPQKLSTNSAPASATLAQTSLALTPAPATGFYGSGQTLGAEPPEVRHTAARDHTLLNLKSEPLETLGGTMFPEYENWGPSDTSFYYGGDSWKRRGGLHHGASGSYTRSYDYSGPQTRFTRGLYNATDGEMYGATPLQEAPGPLARTAGPAVSNHFQGPVPDYESGFGGLQSKYGGYEPVSHIRGANPSKHIKYNPAAEYEIADDRYGGRGNYDPLDYVDDDY